MDAILHICRMSQRDAILHICRISYSIQIEKVGNGLSPLSLYEYRFETVNMKIEDGLRNHYYSVNYLHSSLKDLDYWKTDTHLNYFQTENT